MIRTPRAHFFLLKEFHLKIFSVWLVKTCNSFQFELVWLPKLHLVTRMFLCYGCQLYDDSAGKCISHQRNCACGCNRLWCLLLQLSALQHIFHFHSFIICKFERQNIISFLSLSSDSYLLVTCWVPSDFLQF